MTKAIDVLYVEDNEDYIEFVRRAVKKIDSNLSYHAVTDGQDAISYLNQSLEKDNAAKLILMDINLPGINGIEVLKKIRSNPKAKYVPVIMFSTSDNPNDVISSYDNGANAYLVKPEGLNSLVKTLQSVYDFG